MSTTLIIALVVLVPAFVGGGLAWYFTKDVKKPINAISIQIMDQLGSVYAVACIPRDSVVDAMYISTKDILQLVLLSTVLEGATQYQWLEIQKAEKGKDGNIIGKPTGAYKAEKMYNVTQQHNMINVTGEADIKRVWEWLGTDIPAEDLFRMRDEGRKLLAEFKEKKKKEAEEKELAEKNKSAEEILNGDKDVVIDNKITAEDVRKHGIPEEEFKGPRKMRIVERDGVDSKDQPQSHDAPETNHSPEVPNTH